MRLFSFSVQAVAIVSLLFLPERKLRDVNVLYLGQSEEPDSNSAEIRWRYFAGQATELPIFQRFHCSCQSRPQIQRFFFCGFGFEVPFPVFPLSDELSEEDQSIWKVY